MTVSWWQRWKGLPKRLSPRENVRRTPMVRQLRILHQSAHYVLVAPPNIESSYADILDDMEFLLEAGYRPLYPVTGLGVPEGCEGFVCERLRREPTEASSAGLERGRG